MTTLNQGSDVDQSGSVESVEWRSVPSTGGLYEVSSVGQVRTSRRRGTRGGILAQQWNETGYAIVQMCVLGVKQHARVNRLVLDAFVGPEPELHSRHLDGNPRNNKLENLAWGTRSENVRDAIRHGTHWSPWQAKTHCIRGHEFNETNTYWRSNGRKSCKACKADHSRSAHARRKSLSRRSTPELGDVADVA
ncbi:HNH endonuclease signature motif containing protein [Micromonosporaceae bacterium Da 78-11]